MPLKIYQGESRPVNLCLTKGKAPYPIPAGATIFIGVKREVEDEFYTFFIMDASITKIEAKGIITFTPTPAQTNQPPGVYALQVSITEANGNITKTEPDTLEIEQGPIPYGEEGELAATLKVITAAGTGTA